ncbi:hypothetical protein B0H13DRAFT_2462022 [Mycena leptocephala]|nr:hypothetical protein B0H13DRAFT_2462022 [Mycena leptocephala]
MNKNRQLRLEHKKMWTTMKMAIVMPSARFTALRAVCLSPFTGYVVKFTSGIAVLHRPGIRPALAVKEGDDKRLASDSGQMANTRDIWDIGQWTAAHEILCQGTCGHKGNAILIEEMSFQMVSNFKAVHCQGFSLIQSEKNIATRSAPAEARKRCQKTLFRTINSGAGNRILACCKMRYDGGNVRSCAPRTQPELQYEAEIAVGGHEIERESAGTGLQQGSKGKNDVTQGDCNLPNLVSLNRLFSRRLVKPWQSSKIFIVRESAR